tara:strand:- start:9 stop:221 length:213 start_codon:yes stop_codon:yes gene_type:complete
MNYFRLLRLSGKTVAHYHQHQQLQYMFLQKMLTVLLEYYKKLNNHQHHHQLLCQLNPLLHQPLLNNHLKH